MMAASPHLGQDSMLAAGSNSESTVSPLTRDQLQQALIHLLKVFVRLQILPVSAIESFLIRHTTNVLVGCFSSPEWFQFPYYDSFGIRRKPQPGAERKRRSSVVQIMYACINRVYNVVVCACVFVPIATPQTARKTTWLVLQLFSDRRPSLYDSVSSCRPQPFKSLSLLWSSPLSCFYLIKNRKEVHIFWLQVKSSQGNRVFCWWQLLACTLCLLTSINIIYVFNEVDNWSAHWCSAVFEGGFLLFCHLFNWYLFDFGLVQ